MVIFSSCSKEETPPTLLNPPSNLVVNAISAEQIDLIWRDNTGRFISVIGTCQARRTHLLARC
jgi:hypothetical protein